MMTHGGVDHLIGYGGASVQQQQQQPPPLSIGPHHHHQHPPQPHLDQRPHIPTSASDPCAQIAHVLQCYQQGGDQSDFVRKAIESLVKKLKDKRPELDSLIEAVTTSGRSPTGCVTIQRSLDGRLQVAGRKGVPHVVYARIWRFPDINRNELQKLPICRISHDNQDLICVNPYHYERVVSTGITNIDLSSLRIDPSAIVATSSPPSSCAHSQQQHDQHKTEVSIGAWMSNAGVTSASASSSSYAVASDHFQPNYALTTHIARDDMHMHQHRQQQLHQSPPRLAFDLNTVQVPMNLPYLEHWCSISYYELDTQIGEPFKVRREQTEVIIDGGMDPAGTRIGRFCLGALPNVHRTEASEKARLHIGKGVRFTLCPDGNVYLECLSAKAIFVRSYFLDFEHNCDYGSTVHRFVCGAPTRKVHLVTIYDIIYNQIVIFDLRWAYAEMKRQSESAQMAVVAQAAAVAGLVRNITPQLLCEHAGTGVDDLRRVCCTIGISFVKGWGTGYNRRVIKETPTWCELQLHRPLQLLDQVLHQMPGNSG